MLAFIFFIVILLILGTCAAGWFAIYVIAAGATSKKKARQNADIIIGAAFDGTPDVVFKINSETPDFEDVVLGAKARGYRLAVKTDTSEFTKTLIFEKHQEPVTGS